VEDVNIPWKKLNNFSGECVCIEVGSGIVVNKRFVAVRFGASHLVSHNFTLLLFLRQQRA
jgi:hypothetical protein